METRKTGKHPALGAPYGSPTGRLRRSEPEMQELPGAKQKRAEAMAKALLLFYGGEGAGNPVLRSTGE